MIVKKTREKKNSFHLLSMTLPERKTRF